VQAHPQAEAPLRSWYASARRAQWASPTEVKAIYRGASVLPGSRVVSNMKGNDICLVVTVHYDRKIMYIRFIGSHAQ
jgi:mRNA interferase HigB